MMRVMSDSARWGSASWDAAVEELARSSKVTLDVDLLRRYRFDPDLFSRLRQKAASHGAAGDGGVPELEPLPLDDLELLRPGDVLGPEAYEGPERTALVAEGEAMLRRGEVAVLVWAGGMATRFGGVVKACVPVITGRPGHADLTFLGAKAHDVVHTARRLGARIPFVVMTSFATDQAIRDELERHQRYGLAADELYVFAQSVLLRLTPDGALFVDDGEASPYAPGHGDFFAALRQSGTLAELLRRGVTLIAASNVDNLGALLDPALLALVRQSGKAMVAEVTRAAPGEKGASAVRVAQGPGEKGRRPTEVRLVEYVRLPRGLSLPDALLNTNNLHFDAQAIDREIALPFFPVLKKIGDRQALQYEQITCEVCAVRGPEGGPLLPLGLVDVRRDGPGGRFFPVKEPADLEALREPLASRLVAAWGALP
jgi:UTP--glucose-1-phosphate uridylyltransferase